MAQPLVTPVPESLPRSAPSVAPTEPRPRLLDGGDQMRLDQAVEEQRLARLGTEVLRQLVTLGSPHIDVLARYLGITVHEVTCCAEGRNRLPRGARRNLARVAMAFAPGSVRHTARRLLEGELGRLVGSR